MASRTNVDTTWPAEYSLVYFISVFLKWSIYSILHLKKFASSLPTLSATYQMAVHIVGFLVEHGVEHLLHPLRHRVAPVILGRALLQLVEIARLQGAAVAAVNGLASAHRHRSPSPKSNGSSPWGGGDTITHKRRPFFASVAVPRSWSFWGLQSLRQLRSLALRLPGDQAVVNPRQETTATRQRAPQERTGAQVSS